MTALRATLVGSAAVAAIGLYLSFMSLSDLVVLTGRSRIEAEAWAVAVDGLVVVSTFVVYVARSHRGYAWAAFIATSAATLAANVTYALLFPGQLAPALSAVIAAAPPFAHVVATHLTVLLLRDRAARAEEATIAPMQVADDAPDIPAVEAPRELHAVAQTPEVDAPVDSPVDERVARAFAALNSGATQREAAETAGVSVRTIRRWQTTVA